MRSLGAGIVGTSIALQLARGGLGVALVDRRAPGEETSYGNAGIVEGKSVCPIVLHPSGTGIGSVYQVLSRGNQEIGKSTRSRPGVTGGRSSGPNSSPRES
jgi:D-amino-acid dehydrogenase